MSQLSLCERLTKTLLPGSRAVFKRFKFNLGGRPLVITETSIVFDNTYKLKYLASNDIVLDSDVPFLPFLHQLCRIVLRPNGQSSVTESWPLVGDTKTVNCHTEFTGIV